MTQATDANPTPGVAVPTTEPGLTGLLRRANQRARGSRLLGLLLLATGAMGLAGLAAVALDALYGLPAWGLIGLDLVWIGLALWWLARLAVSWHRGRFDPRRTAVALEQQSGVPGSRLINALDLDADDIPADRRSPALRQRAVEAGHAAAHGIDPAALTDRAALSKGLRLAIGAAVLLAVGVFVMPRVFHAVVPRLFAPLADLPPYTPLRFHVAIGPEVIHVGKPAVVELTLTQAGYRSKPLPATAEIVLLPHNPAEADPSSPDQAAVMVPIALPTTDRPDEAAANDDAAPAAARFTHRFERVAEPMRFFIRTEAGRSHVYTITPDTAPLLETLHASVLPPDYTGFKPLTQRLSTTPPADDPHGSSPTDAGEVRAMVGSALTLTLGSNVPLRHGQLAPADQPGSGPTTAPLRDDPQAVELTHIVTGSAELALTLQGLDGHAGQRPAHVTITAVEDRAPAVDITSPDPIVIAPVGWEVPVTVVAKDDVGITQFRLHVSVVPTDSNTTPESDEGEPENEGDRDTDAEPTYTDLDLAPAPTDDDAPRPTRVAHPTLKLDELGAKSGDTVRYYATARDNLPTAYGGPPNDVGQLAETPVYHIQVVSQEEWNAYARAAYGIEDLSEEWHEFQDRLDELEAARSDILEQLQKLQDKLADGGELTDLERQQLADLQQQLAEYEQGAQNLAQSMLDRAEQPDLYEFEQPFKDMLREMAKDVQQQAERSAALNQALQDMAQSPNRSPRLDRSLQMQADAFEREEEAFSEEAQQAREQTEEDLEMLELADEMMYHAERVKQAILAQRELETKLAEMKLLDPETLSEEQLQRLETWADMELVLRDELEDSTLMLRESAELAGTLLPNMAVSAAQIAESLEHLAVYPDMEDASEFMRATNPSMAHASADYAADKLDSLLSTSEGMAGQAMSDLDGALQLRRDGLQQALDQMAQSRARSLAQRLGQMQSGQGSGVGGAQSSVSLMGPHQPSTGNANSRSSNQRGGNGPGRTTNDLIDPELGQAEALNPLDTDTTGRASITVPGVPARYQDIAAAYFQRLADDAGRLEPSSE